ncbi:purine-nucleoside phosphorylase [Shivajiella indica]|uniref:Purine nucleoside phosphorylase n=1 Tax=Shivajiella indica TaxID=872115 RepID=A0ABW5B9H9_9BACT
MQETVDFISEFLPEIPGVAIILGSGLGGLVNELEGQVSIPYEKIPQFPVSTVEGHSGQLIFGYLNKLPVLAMSGRFHYYEGYSLNEVVFPVRVMKLLGIERLIVTNAAGGLNPEFEAGDLMLIEDIISLMPDNPLRGKNEDNLGPRFPDMSEPFDLGWTEKAKNIAKDMNIDLRTGVYVGLQGPKLETKAEIRYLRIIGGDAVGMSTVSEIIAAHHMGMKVIAFSVITNESIPKVKKEFTHQEVVEVANRAGEKLVRLVKGIV